MKDALITLLFNAWMFTITLADVERYLQVLCILLTVVYTLMKIQNERILKKTLEAEKEKEK